MASKGNNENTKTISMDVILRFRLGDQCTLPSNILSTLLKFHFRCFFAHFFSIVYNLSSSSIFGDGISDKKNHFSL